MTLVQGSQHRPGPWSPEGKDAAGGCLSHRSDNSSSEAGRSQCGLLAGGVFLCSFGPQAAAPTKTSAPTATSPALHLQRLFVRDLCGEERERGEREKILAQVVCLQRPFGLVEGFSLARPGGRLLERGWLETNRRSCLAAVANTGVSQHSHRAQRKECSTLRLLFHAAFGEHGDLNSHRDPYPTTTRPSGTAARTKLLPTRALRPATPSSCPQECKWGRPKDRGSAISSRPSKT